MYELAHNGSLERFWKSEAGRSRLSFGLTRIKIAFQVAKVLRYMHEGLDGGDVCFHRDVKSANVCLSAQFDALVIDCGLSKYVSEDDTGYPSGGSKGSVGYICPEYNDGDIDYQSACDVFSFGVTLCEIITGKQSVKGNHHYTIFRKKQKRNLLDDVDELVDWKDGAESKLVSLAMECIHPDADQRPTIATVVGTLGGMLYNTPANNSNLQEEPILSNLSLTETEEHKGKKCRTCGNTGSSYIQCGGSEPHVQCQQCHEADLEAALKTSKRYHFKCLKAGCDSPPYKDVDVHRHISQNLWGLYLKECHWHDEKNHLAANSTFVASQFVATNDRVDTSLKLQTQLRSKDGNKCPRRFILIDAPTPGQPWKHPREWARNLKSTKLYIYFVCSHSNALLSDKTRIKLRYTPETLKKIAPAWNVSLWLIQQAAQASGIELPLDKLRIDQMDEWVRDLLEPQDRQVLDAARNANNVLQDANVQKLVGTAMACVAEKASENIEWQNELDEAFDFEKKEATYVMPRFKTLQRYNQWQSNSAA